MQPYTNDSIRIINEPSLATDLLVQPAASHGCCWLTVEITCKEDPRMKPVYAPVFLCTTELDHLIIELQKLQSKS